MEHPRPECDDAVSYHTHFDASNPNEPATAIVRALSTVTETPPTELDPLYETVDTDALNRLFGRPDTSLSLEFDVDDWTVVVTDEGRLSVERP